MAKRWSAFLEAEVASSARFLRIIAASTFLSTSILVIVPGISPILSANAQEGTPKIIPTISPTGIPSAHPEDLETEFLKLPAYDLEQVHPLSSSPLCVGDQIHFKIKNLDLTGKKIELWYSEEKTHETGWDILFEGTQITAVPLKAGKLNILPMSIQDSQGQRIARTQAFSLEVKSAILANDPKPKEPEKVEPPLSLFFPWWVIVGISLIGLGIGVVIVYVIVRFLRKKLKSVVSSPQPVLSEDELAFIQLQKLEDQNLLKQGKFKVHYFGISNILKAYLGSRFAFDAPDCTTREMLLTLSEQSLLKESELEELKRYFEVLDRVKFTDYSPQDTESYPLITQAREFIRKTRRLPPVETDLSKSSSSPIIVESEVGVPK